MTPEEARALLYEGHEVKTTKVKDGDGDDYWQVQYRDSYWNRLPNAPYEDAVLYAAAPDMAAMIAGMREEWRAELQGAEGGWHVLPDHKGREWGGREWAGAIAAQWHSDGFRVRLVPRYVTEPEEA